MVVPAWFIACLSGSHTNMGSGEQWNSKPTYG